MVHKPDFLKLRTFTFDDISNNNNISRLHSNITDVIPTKFNALKECGLLNNLLTQITKTSQDLNDNMETFKREISAHKDIYVDNEYRMSERLANLGNINIKIPKQ